MLPGSLGGIQETRYMQFKSAATVTFSFSPAEYIMGQKHFCGGPTFPSHSWSRFAEAEQDKISQESRQG